MKLLLDTDVLLWWANGHSRLKDDVREMILSPANEIIVSVVSLWEIVVKIRVGKLDAHLAEIEQSFNEDGFNRLAISSAHLATLANLPSHHRDPFDHLLIAQAVTEDAILVSDDRAMSLYPVRLFSGAENR